MNDARSFGKRLLRERRTLHLMIALYCRAHHHAEDGLCEACAKLRAYALRRLDYCVFGEDKPACAACAVHCFSAPMREQIRIVMRFAGPRLLFSHPCLAIRHLLDSRRPMPDFHEAVQARKKR